MQKQLEDAVNFEGSAEEKKIRAYFASLGLDHDTLTKEEFVAIISALKKSKHLKSPISQRGKGRDGEIFTHNTKPLQLLSCWDENCSGFQIRCVLG